MGEARRADICARQFQFRRKTLTRGRRGPTRPRSPCRRSRTCPAIPNRRRMVPIARVRSLLNGATTTNLGLDPAARGSHRRIIAPQTAGAVQVFGRRQRRNSPHAQRPASKKRRGTKSRGAGQPGGQPALWGFHFRADYDGRREAGAMAARIAVRAAGGRAQQDLGGGVGRIKRRAGRLIGLVLPRGTAAGASQCTGKRRRAQAVRLMMCRPAVGVGRHLGSQPRAKTSMTIMRAPQRGHGHGSTRGASGAISDGCCGSAAGGAASSNARAVAMFSARLALAKSP